ncbi:MAG: redoxin domain-containing protein [Verrucomicrobiales bacterium]|nr:redoxin domain-containing protein [Verrucomicrobiales bacterium]
MAEVTPATDQWAGKSVQTAEHIQGMIGDRLHNAPKEQERAPSFALTNAQTGNTHTLSELHQRKPVVLFFGSRSCSATQHSGEAVNQLWKRFGRKVDFYLVYIREAHPAGDNHFAGRTSFAAPDPGTDKERRMAALEFATEREIEFPVLVDRVDDAAAVRWGAWPVRLFMIDQSGTVIFAGQQGPWYHKPTRDFNSGLSNAPDAIKDLPGYSSGSLEDLLEKRYELVPSIQ